MRNLITIVLIFYNSFIHAKTFVSVSDGAWDNPSIWDLNDGTYPSLTDDVILNHTVNARSSDNTETRALTINASGVLNLNSSYEFRFRESSGTLNNNGTINGPGTLRPVPVSTIVLRFLWWQSFKVFSKDLNLIFFELLYLSKNIIFFWLYHSLINWYYFYIENCNF